MKIRRKSGVDSARVEGLFRQVSGKEETEIPPEFNPKAYTLFDEDAVTQHAKEILRKNSVNSLLEDTGFDWNQSGVYEMTIEDAEGTMRLLAEVTESGKPYNKRVLLPFFAKKEARMRTRKPMKLPGDAEERLTGTAEKIRGGILRITTDGERKQYESLVNAYMRLHEAAVI